MTEIQYRAEVAEIERRIEAVEATNARCQRMNAVTGCLTVCAYIAVAAFVIASLVS